MSSFFSRSSSRANSAASSITSKKSAKEAPPPTSEIFTTPPEGVTATKKWEYDQEQLEKIEQLREYTSTLILPESDPYYPWEKRFLSDPGCHPRYMRAAKWRLPEAKTRIKGTIEWRREYKPELIKPGEVGIESETGKIVLSGFDLDARPILYMRPGRENTETSPRQIQHLIFMLERAIDFMPPGQEQVAIIVDYKSATSQSNPSISTARKVLNVLQNHYVERLGRGLVVNMPWWINAFFTGISPFLDPITRDKIRFNPKLVELCPEEQLDFEFGGDYNLDFKYEPYWKTITEFCCIAEDGGRINSKGEMWYPPLGNGIKAAVDGLVPLKGAVQTGEAVNVADEESKDKADPHALASVLAAGIPQTAAQKFAADSREPRESTDTATPPTTADAKESFETAREESGNTESEEATLVGGMKDVHIAVRGDETGTPEPPSTVTKAGEPVGDGLVFDHEPSKKEVKEALKAVGS